jgi:hypothetical protein
VNYDQPRQLQDGSGWHYTTRNDGQIWAIGYCRGHGPHPTEDDARRCYRDYELNEHLRLDHTLSAWVQCEYPGCGGTPENPILTNRAASIGGWIRWHLCDEHRTKECCAELYGEMAGDSIHS